MNVRSLTANVLPKALLNVESVRSSLALRDLVALGGGYDFLLQASNAMCAEAAFSSLHLPWIVGHLDAQAVAVLRASGASFESAALQRAVADSVGVAGTAGDVLLIFGAHDVLFDGVDKCRVRLSVNIALGSMFVMPKAPGLAHGLKPGEAVQLALTPRRVIDPVSRISEEQFTVGTTRTAEPPAMRMLSDIRPGTPGIADIRAGLEVDRNLSIREFNRKIDLGDGSSFDVSAWLGGAVLEIPAPFAATIDQTSTVIRVAADVQQSTAKFTELSGDAALLLSDADPLGVVMDTTQHVRRRGSVALIDEVSLVGAPASARVNHSFALAADTFPCRTGACPLNVAATLAPWHVGTRSASEFIGSSRYGVVWSSDAVKLLVQYCWDSHAFPRGFAQTWTDGVEITIDGVTQKADAISIFQFESLDRIELEYDSNGRRDVLYTYGLARIVPKLIRLHDGRELIPTDPNDPHFKPSDRFPWQALGDLTEEILTAPNPEILLFERIVTRGVTIRFGRPFTDPPFGAVVTDSRISAPAQRIAVLVS